MAESPSLLLLGMLALGLASVHIGAGYLRFLDVIPRSRWLSLASGVSVAYVFIHILPELSHHQAQLFEGKTGKEWTWLDHHIFLLSLMGLVAFYGLERLAQRSRRQAAETPPHHCAQSQTEATFTGIFWLHMGSYGLYNALIGYLLVHREDQSLQNLLLFFSAMALHFVVNDYGLRHHYRAAYHRYGRWLLALAAVVGWLVGVATGVHETFIAILFALLSGGVILNVLKEELPEERESRFWAFALGVCGYALILMAL
jgi:hypothetical protein